MKEKIKINVNEMKFKQAIDWVEEIFRSVALGSVEESAYPEVLKRLRELSSIYEDKLVKQEKVINFVLSGTKLSGKDKGELIKLLLE